MQVGIAEWIRRSLCCALAFPVGIALGFVAIGNIVVGDDEVNRTTPAFHSLAGSIPLAGDDPESNSFLEPSEVFQAFSEGDASQPELTVVGGPPRNLKELMKPIIRLNGEYITDGGDVPLATTGIRVSVPTYPLWGPPPPLIDLGYQSTWLHTPAEMQLPEHFHEYQVGASWMRILNEDWKMRLWAGTSFNTDGENTSSDALQFRGGLFAIYSVSPEFEWIMGVVALGRSDLPAVPALGLIYRPNDDWTFDFTFPRPQATYVYERTDDRQHSVYLGGGLNGTTWAFAEPNGRENQITYSDWRAVLGWESSPFSPTGSRFTPGKRLKVETGYVFARRLEFDDVRPDISLNNGWTVNASFNF
ncbi:hypothetical protein Pla110_26760 [Polystyrenella longa]|uniref:DUF6268 domain-containing protein n=1 Tax=Polystyrenella longa TaxID=2528007 RepID=A0A518CNY5_9PLAN|nr:DUF6268 family outer membrane beta-barrel protein [Polystyrenella longa]QDU80940.1 hypothetical protein Pla110_26760 [Polystyrenella longa]